MGSKMAHRKPWREQGQSPEFGPFLEFSLNVVSARNGIRVSYLVSLPFSGILGTSVFRALNSPRSKGVRVLGSEVNVA